MKPANWVCSTFSKFLAVCLLLIATHAQATVIQITDAQLFEGNAPPGAESVWQALSLPAHWVTAESEPIKRHWVRVDFSVDKVPDSGLVLYVPRLYNGGYFYLNGRRLTAARTPTDQQFVRWRRPFLIEMPGALLQPGNNEIKLETAFGPGVNGLSRMYVGDALTLEARYDASFFFKHTITRMVAVFSLLAGLFLMLFWARRRQEVQYGLLGAASLAWALRTMNFVVEVISADLRPLLRFFYYLGTGVFVLCIALMTLRIVQMRSKKFEGFLLVYCLVGPLLSLLSWSHADAVVDQYWQGGLLALSAVGIAMVARIVIRKPTLETCGLLIAIAIALLTALNDLLITIGVFGFDAPYGVHLAAPLLVLVMGVILIERFVNTLNTVEGMTHSLIDEVAEREKELRTKYEEIHAFERRRVTLEERTRIMQDMHDGLGSQLLSSLVMVERTEVSKQEMVGILRDALDDLRLAIDAFAPDGADLLPALGNLRFRMQSRFKAAGITLNWNVVNVPDTLTLPSTSTLPILRIAQESLTNILKHANATEANVQISTQANPLALIISINDNGNGFDIALLPQRGRGLTNLRKRANRAGATLRIASKAGQGTQIFLVVPLAS